MSLGQAIPWLDTFQRSRGLEGDVMVLGIGDGEVMLALGAQVQAGERLVIIDALPQGLFPGERGLMNRLGVRNLIVINEHPASVMGTEAMDLEHGQYRIVACEARYATAAVPLLCPGGLMLFASDLFVYPVVLYPVSSVGRGRLLTTDATWQDDYRKVLSSLPKEES